MHENEYCVGHVSDWVHELEFSVSMSRVIFCCLSYVSYISSMRKQRLKHEGRRPDPSLYRHPTFDDLSISTKYRHRLIALDRRGLLLMIGAYSQKMNGIDSLLAA